MFLPYIVDITDDVALVGWYRQDTGTAVAAVDVASYSLTGWEVLPGTPIVGVTIVPNAAFLVAVDLVPNGPVDGDLFGTAPWDAGKRGLLGEWFSGGLLRYYV